MSMVDSLVLAAIAAAVVAAIAWITRRRKQCKGGCGCCPYQKNCNTRRAGVIKEHQ